MFKRKLGSFSASQNPGESTEHGDGKASAKEQIKTKRKQIERFLQYIIPPFALTAATVGIFMPSYQSDPVSDNND